MSADDTPDDGRERATGDAADEDPDDRQDGTAGTADDERSQEDSAPESDGDRREELAERLEESTDRAVEEFDQRIVDLLAWLLDTETRARIYVYLRQNPNSTSEEITDGTGLYPSTVREALAELNDEGTVERRKRDTDGAGNNPYEYTAIAPSDLVGSVAGQIQRELNTVFNLDDHLDRGSSADTDTEPVTITVEDVEANDRSSQTGDEHDENDESDR